MLTSFQQYLRWQSGIRRRRFSFKSCRNVFRLISCLLTIGGDDCGGGGDGGDGGDGGGGCDGDGGGGGDGGINGDCPP